MTFIGHGTVWRRIRERRKNKDIIDLLTKAHQKAYQKEMLKNLINLEELKYTPIELLDIIARYCPHPLTEAN